ncbi:MAG: YIP1 family protein [Rhodanobacter sp.]
MDFAKITARVKAILTNPKAEWPIIATEPASVGSLYAGYIVILAALPAVAGFIKGSVIGFGMFGVTVRTPIGAGIGSMVLSYLLALVVVYVMALVINALAPTFGGQKDSVQALKTIAYAWTASWLASVAIIVPWLGWIIALAGAVYAIYLLYLGLPHTMKCPSEKAAGYTAVSVIIAIVLTWVMGLLVAGMMGTAGLSGAAMSGAHITGADGSRVSIDSNSVMGKLAAMGQRAEQASKAMEAAQKSGDSKAQQAAMGKMIGAVAGNNGSVEALSTESLKAFLPDSLGSLTRSNLSASRNSAMGLQTSQASADYGNDTGTKISLEVADTGTAKGFVAMAAALAPEQENETEHGYEKTYTRNGRMVHEAWDTRAKRGEYRVVIGQRYTVKAHGQADHIDQLKKAVAEVDLSKLESMKNAGVTAD